MWFMIMSSKFVRLLIIILLFTLVACVVGKNGPGITSQNSAWIEKGRTTREQVVTRFGEPAFLGMYKGVGEYAEYTVSSPTPLTLEPTQGGPQPQVHRSPVDISVNDIGKSDDRFWVIYNAQGVVHDLGFGAPPE